MQTTVLRTLQSVQIELEQVWMAHPLGALERARAQISAATAALESGMRPDDLLEIKPDGTIQPVARRAVKTLDEDF
jgi:hypothetical protein